MEKATLDSFILAQLSAMCPALPAKTTYRFRGQKICRKMFRICNGISEKRLKSLLEHFRAFGIAPRVHGNSGRRPHNTTMEGTVKDMLSFLDNYAITHGLHLPGRVAGIRNGRSVVLPANHTMTFVHKDYQDSCLKYKKHMPILYQKFCDLWKTFRPYLVTANPRSDLCFTCQENVNLIIKSSNEHIEKKSAALFEQEEHLTHAREQRAYYKEKIELSKYTYHQIQPDLSFSQKLPNSVDVTSIYSFDYAQQVSYPCNPEQPGAIFFKVPRKCALFGICNEAINRQITYVIDESADCGKGANGVISYLHHYLNTYGVGEKFLHLQADNCSGQNKNNIMVHYLLWRVSQGFHTKISLNFMLAGHTKFSPDRCFGLIKQNYQRNYVSSLYDVADVINNSSDATNIAQLAGLPSGAVLVPVYDWQNFFSKIYKKLPKILPYHHFRFDAEDTGSIFVKEFSGTAEIDVKVVKMSPAVGFPKQILPKGMSKERKQYLYKEIRPFCRPGTENLVAPNPT